MSYDANSDDAIGTMTAGKYKDWTYKTKDKLYVEQNNFGIENYEFISWNTKADGTGQTYNAGDEIVLTEDITLFAQWNNNTGGDIVPVEETENVDDEEIPEEVPSETSEEKNIAVETTSKNTDDELTNEEVSEDKMDGADNIPDDELPQTGGIPLNVMMGLGALMTASGLTIRVKK